MTATVVKPRRAALTFAPDPEMSFWPTPPEVADDLVLAVLTPAMVQGWKPGEGVRVLEPSAGDGHLAREVRRHLPYAHITCVEPSPARAAGLRDQPGLADEVVEDTLEGYLLAVATSAQTGQFEPFDAVVMNPPFTLPGRDEAWAEHFLAIYNDPHLLAPYGQVSAVVPRIVMTGKSRLVRAVRALLPPHYGIEECERGAFEAVGAKLSTALIWAEKSAPDTAGDSWQPSLFEAVR